MHNPSIAAHAVAERDERDGREDGPADVVGGRGGEEAEHVRDGARVAQGDAEELVLEGVDGVAAAGDVGDGVRGGEERGGPGVGGGEEGDGVGVERRRGVGGVDGEGWADEAVFVWGNHFEGDL